MEMMPDHVIRPRVTMVASGLNHPDCRGVMVAAVIGAFGQSTSDQTRGSSCRCGGSRARWGCQCSEARRQGIGTSAASPREVSGLKGVQHGHEQLPLLGCCRVGQPHDDTQMTGKNDGEASGDA